MIYRHCRAEPTSLLDPFDALADLAHPEYVALLESRGPTVSFGRYSFLCVDPSYVFRSRRSHAFAGKLGEVHELRGKPFAELKSLFAQFNNFSGWSPGLPTFMGGWVGYLGYELLYELETISNFGRDDLPLPDTHLVLYNTVVATDWVLGRSWVISNSFGDSRSAAEAATLARVGQVLEKLKGVRPSTDPETRARLLERRSEILRSRRLDDATLARLGVHPVLDHATYVKRIETAKEHIFAGDVFEVCMTNRFDIAGGTGGASGLDLYRVLRIVNEAPFSSYLRHGDVEVACSSPERFLSLDRERWAETRPIKGTRPRGPTPEADAALRHDLATCEKDQAENIMIADLARNDLGRVCEFGSISVPDLRVVESYPFCHQLVSTVRGRLRKDLGAVDLIRATFPPGSMTGAPKVESLKIINRLEPVKRGIFSGSIGYFDHDGSLDLNIVIRTFIKKGDSLSFHVGGAIVADSDPEEEYQETLDKGHGLVTALELVRDSRP